MARHSCRRVCTGLGRRAFARLAERWGEARQELKNLKDLKEEQWRATVVAAVRGQRNAAEEPAPEASSSSRALSPEEEAVLGRDGLVRVRLYPFLTLQTRHLGQLQWLYLGEEHQGLCRYVGSCGPAS